LPGRWVCIISPTRLATRLLGHRLPVVTRQGPESPREAVKAGSTRLRCPRRDCPGLTSAPYCVHAFSRPSSSTREVARHVVSFWNAGLPSSELSTEQRTANPDPFPHLWRRRCSPPSPGVGWRFTLPSLSSGLSSPGMPRRRMGSRSPSSQLASAKN
jgi:hypothetical protein